MKAKNILTYVSTLAGAAIIAAACGSAPKKTTVPMYMPNSNVSGQPQSTCILRDDLGNQVGEAMDYGFDNVSDHVIVDIKQDGRTVTREFARRAESSTNDDWMRHPGASPLDAATYIEIVRDKAGNARYKDPHIKYMIRKDCSHRELQDGFQAAATAQIPLEIIVIQDDGTAYAPNMPK
jgi:ABC-type oligopeptide transport system substrate-binding subunit